MPARRLLEPRHDERIARLLLGRVGEPGDVALARAIDDLGAVETVRRLRAGTLTHRGLVNLRARLDVARPDRDLAAGALRRRALRDSWRRGVARSGRRPGAAGRRRRGRAARAVGSRARSICGPRADGRSRSSARGRRPRTAITWPASSASVLPSGRGPSSRGARTASTALRIGGRCGRRGRLLRCSLAASTSPIRAGTRR